MNDKDMLKMYNSILDFNLISLAIQSKLSYTIMVYIASQFSSTRFTKP